MKNSYPPLKQYKKIILFTGFFSFLFLHNTSFAPSSWICFAKTPKYLKAQRSPYKTVIFDLGGVIFRTNPYLKHKLIAQTIWNNPALLWYLLSLDTKKEYFKILESIKETETLARMYDNDQPLPYIFTDWQTSTKTTAECCRLAHQAINDNQAKYAQAVQNLLRNIAEFNFSPELLCSSQEPIKDMIEIIKILKEEEYTLYVLSNWDKESFEKMKTKYSDIFNLFDGIMISGQEKMIKPSEEFFHCLLKKYNIAPETAIFIDDQKINIEIGKKIGLNTIHCLSTKAVTEQLESFQILTKTSNVY